MQSTIMTIRLNNNKSHSSNTEKDILVSEEGKMIAEAESIGDTFAWKIT